MFYCARPAIPLLFPILFKPSQKHSKKRSVLTKFERPSESLRVCGLGWALGPRCAGEERAGERESGSEDRLSPFTSLSAPIREVEREVPAAQPERRKKTRLLP